MAANLPVVRELLRDGIEGLLFEPDNAEELARQIVRVLRSRELAERLGAARRAARTLSCVGHGAARLLALYDQLLGHALGDAHRALPAHTPCASPSAVWPSDADSLSEA